MKWVLALDPGSDKCGYAVVRYDGTAGEKGVVLLHDLPNIVRRLCTDPFPEAIVIGKGTARTGTAALIESVAMGLPVHFVQEKNTTREARERYFRDNPPQGLWRLVPIGLQFPSRPIDDYAAWIIGERYLRSNL
ncbi:MAG: resolvase [Candidatus Riflebacteria bacterium]|nr:resolvase [Candidatus Riflebacteria bacterium]